MTIACRRFASARRGSWTDGLENQYSGAVDGMAADLSGAAKTNGFEYLKGSVTFDDLSPGVSESYGYIAKKAATSNGATYTPYLTLPVPGTGENGSLLGVYAKDGREQLISTVASNASQQHWKVLSHGIVSWLTRGISTSYSRNFFAVQVDDVLLPDAEWNAEGNCTVGDDCNPATYPETAPGATSRMTAQDVGQLAAWQRTNGVKLDVAFNGAGAADQKAETGSETVRKSLMVHELGHALGFGHQNDKTSVMNQDLQTDVPTELDVRIYKETWGGEGSPVGAEPSESYGEEQQSEECAGLGQLRRLASVASVFPGV